MQSGRLCVFGKCSKCNVVRANARIANYRIAKASLQVGGSVPKDDEHQELLPQVAKLPEPATRSGSHDETEATTQMTTLPALTEDTSADGPQLFALVHASDPSHVCYFGIDVGNGAFTVRRDPVTGHTNFGSWQSMTSALKRLDQITGANGQMALVVFDSVPVAAVTALIGSNPFEDSLPTLPANTEMDEGEAS